MCIRDRVIAGLRGGGPIIFIRMIFKALNPKESRKLSVALIVIS